MESNETIIELMQDCPNYLQFEADGFLVTEWNAGAECVASFGQRISESGKLADNILYGHVKVVSEGFSRNFRQIACNPLPPSVFNIVRLISVRIDADKLMGLAEYKSIAMPDDVSIRVKFDLMWSDRDKLRDALREVVGWVSLNETASGICPLPADMVARMRNVLKEVE